MRTVSRRADLTRAPSTPGQRRDWAAHQARPDASFLNLSAAFRTSGPLSRPALERAVAKLVERHEALRTRFEDSGRLTQVIERPGWSGGPRLAVAADLGQDWLTGFTDRRFDLAAEAPFRAGLCTGGDGRDTVALVLHHIVADQLSLGVLIRDLSELLSAEPDLPELPVQFADYATWWDGRHATGGFDRNLEYWRSELDGAPADSRLPLRPTASTAAARHAEEIPLALADGLQSFAARMRTTPYVVLLAAFSAALFELTGTDDQLFGCGYANRQSTSLRHSIGRFSSNMAIRVRGGGDLQDHLRSTHAVAMRAYTNAVVSLDAVNEAGVLGDQRGGRPLTDVAFQLVDGVGALLQVPGADVEPVPREPSSVKQPLNIAVERGPGVLTLHAVYCPDALAPEWVRSLATAFVEQLDRLMAGALAVAP